MISPALFVGALLLEGALFAAWLWLERREYTRERRELLDRLMARNLTEYAVNQARTAQPAGNQERRHNVIANHQARQRGEALVKQPARPANPLLTGAQNDDN